MKGKSSTNNSQVIAHLAQEILHHRQLYYTGKPKISDQDYDALEEQLRRLDPSHPALEMVGHLHIGGEKIKHATRMLSLQKTYKLEELKEWMKEQALVATLKIDGVSCSLVYKKGQLVLAKTRGDGQFGENITLQVQYIQSIPKKIPSSLEEIEIRGEMFCSEENFFLLHKEMISRGLEKPNNQRNIVSGLIGRKENVDLCAYIEFRSFELISAHLELETETEKFQWLNDNGLIPEEVFSIQNADQLPEVLAQANQFMSEGSYPIDGLVFSYNNLLLHRNLGETAHHPRYKMAFKFQGESKQTKILDIEWSLSRKGIYTPVALVEPVELSGAMVGRVTLHNFGMVELHRLKKDDVIEIIRSGEVIPKFLRVIESAPGEIQFPSHCRYCDSLLQQETIRLLCLNPSCPGIVKFQILNFVKKIGIDDLSEKRLDQLLEKKLVRSIADLYRLSEEDFLSLEKTKEKLAKKLFQNIQKTKSSDLLVFLSALGIAGGAENKISMILKSGFSTLQKILELKVSDLLQIDGFAEKSAVDFLNSLAQKHEVIRELVAQGFDPQWSNEILSGPLKGKSFCITGALSIKRSHAQSMIKEKGGEVHSNVTAQTQYLILGEGEENSSKKTKAEKIGTKIISEKEFLQLLHGPS